jgi:TolB protein
MIMNKNEKYIFIIIIMIVVNYALLLCQEVTIKVIVEGKGFKPMVLGLQNVYLMEDNEETREAARVAYEVLKNDLNFSRLFTIIESSEYEDLPVYKGSDIDLLAWRKRKADFVVLIKILVKESDLTFEGRLLDVRTGDLLKGKKYNWDKKYLRQVVHRFGNEIINVTWGIKVPLFTSKIAFVSDRDGNKEIYLMDYDGYDQRRVTNNTILDLFPALSPDGENIVFSTVRGTKAVLLLYNLYTGNKIILSDVGGLNSLATWSADGQKIAFISSRDGNAEIYTINADGSDLRRITFSPSIEASPAWSPTGRQIAFTSDRSGRPQIYIMDAEGTNVRRLTFYGDYNESPAFSPDGTQLLFVQRIGISFDIYKLDLQSQEIIRLTENQGSNESPKWSPDGLHIVFSSNRTGKYQIYVMDNDGTNQKQLTYQGNNTNPSWQISK